MKQKILLAALCACAGLAGSASAATATAHAQASDIQFTLIDLNPDDGIAPSLTLGDSSTSGATFLDNGWSYELQDNIRSIGRARISRSYGSAEATVAADSISSSATMSQVDARRVFQAAASITRDFTLSPYTAVIWSSSGELGVQRPDGVTGSDASVTLSVDYRDIGDIYQEYRTMSEGYSTDQGSSPFTLSLRFESAAQATSGQISLLAMVNAAIPNLSTPPVIQVPTQPVPEPETYGMLAAGLLVMGARLRRLRRQRARAAAHLEQSSRKQS